MFEPYRILVVGPSWVGDMVMAQSLFIALKQQQPGCLIDVLAPAWSLPLLERMPEVRHPVAMPLRRGQFGLFARRRVGHSLREPAYDQAILLPNSWKSALVPFFAAIPKRTGYLGEARWGLLNDIRYLDKSRLTMTVQRFVALGLPADAPQPPVYEYPKFAISAEQQRQVVEKFSLSLEGKVLALCPGAEYGPAKRWPAEHFAAVARQKHAEGWQVWLFGSEKDRAVTAVIDELTGGICQDFAGRTSLAEAVDLLSLSNAVVSNDSGLMHVAAALDKKVVAIYGSSDPGFTPPLHPAAKIVTLKLDCSPCFERDCPLGHSRCLTDIRPEQILAALDS